MSEEKRKELEGYFVPEGYDGCRNCAKRDEKDEACKHAAELRKQIPKKVVREAGKILYSCPNNRLHQMTIDKKGEFRYCSICGQALDWSDVK